MKRYYLSLMFQNDRPLSSNPRESERDEMKRVLQWARDEVNAHIPWASPNLLLSGSKFKKGEHSTEARIQKEREMTSLSSTYFKESDIPDSPAECLNDGYIIPDDSEIPIIALPEHMFASPANVTPLAQPVISNIATPDLSANFSSSNVASLMDQLNTIMKTQPQQTPPKYEAPAYIPQSFPAPITASSAIDILNSFSKQPEVMALLNNSVKPIKGYNNIPFPAPNNLNTVQPAFVSQPYAQPQQYGQYQNPRPYANQPNSLNNSFNAGQKFNNNQPHRQDQYGNPNQHMNYGPPQPFNSATPSTQFQQAPNSFPGSFTSPALSNIHPERMARNNDFRPDNGNQSFNQAYHGGGNQPNNHGYGEDGNSNQFNQGQNSQFNNNQDFRMGNFDNQFNNNQDYRMSNMGNQNQFNQFNNQFQPNNGHNFRPNHDNSGRGRGRGGPGAMPGNRKTSECTHFAKKGYCWRGDDCNFAHTPTGRLG
jgi:hypothetical protein